MLNRQREQRGYSVLVQTLDHQAHRQKIGLRQVLPKHQIGLRREVVILELDPYALAGIAAITQQSVTQKAMVKVRKSTVMFTLVWKNQM